MAVHSRETDHYENFPVASILCPARLRPAIGAIYLFARTADDLADEGELAPAARLQALQAYREDLLAVFRGRSHSPSWAAVFSRLTTVIKDFNLPLSPLTDLLSAFEQDVTKVHYADKDELLDYCRRSANPVGRLLLHLYGVTDVQALARSDAICSALQLSNFWQDLSIDLARKRFYIPLDDLNRHHLTMAHLATQQDSQAVRGLVKSLVIWTRQLMGQGAELPFALQSRAGWRAGFELRLVVQGGLRILDKIEAMDFDSLRRRPQLGTTDALTMLWRALNMKATAPGPKMENS